MGLIIYFDHMKAQSFARGSIDCAFNKQRLEQHANLHDNANQVELINNF